MALPSDESPFHSIPIVLLLVLTCGMLPTILTWLGRHVLAALHHSLRRATVLSGHASLSTHRHTLYPSRTATYSRSQRSKTITESLRNCMRRRPWHKTPCVPCQERCTCHSCAAASFDHTAATQLAAACRHAAA